MLFPFISVYFVIFYTKIALIFEMEGFFYQKLALVIESSVGS